MLQMRKGTIISIDAEGKTWQDLAFILKNSHKTRNRRGFPYLDERYLPKQTNK